MCQRAWGGESKNKNEQVNCSMSMEYLFIIGGEVVIAEKGNKQSASSDGWW